MKQIFTTIRNIFSIKELRERIALTLLFLAVYRLGCHIVLPGIDPTILKESVSNEGILGFIDVFLGGAFNRASIFALGIMPYISASIIMQLLTFSVPAFQKMQKEGESGRRRITQITRVMTIFITFFQGIGYIQGIILPSQAVVPAMGMSMFYVSSLVILTTGTMFAMWMGEKITDRGIGNGISLLIMIGILAGLPGAFYGEITDKADPLLILLEILALFFVVMLIVLLTQGVRRIPIQYARQSAGRGRKQVVGGQRSYLPLKVNAANVMPIIFAQSFMFLPPLLAGYYAESSTAAAWVQQEFSDIQSVSYNAFFAFLIISFTFFYTAITVRPDDIANDLAQSKAFIPGVKQGKPTADYISMIMDRITFPGSLYLAAVAILPAFAMAAGVQQGFAYFYGGTSLIIMVGVTLDTLQQIESELLKRKYDSLMSGGRIKGRTSTIATVAGTAGAAGQPTA